ncbi:MAG TPA: HIT family protein [Bacteroidales bacterium]|nr:HIT family protein [Bacteroidales bacterium]
MSSIFTKIIKGEIPCYKIAEDDRFIAFLDISPLKKGHCLIVPKQEIDYIFDIDNDVLKEMIVFSKRIAIALKKAIPCSRIGVAVLGLEVPHAHIHLVPIVNESDLRFSNTRLVLSPAEFVEIQENIVRHL